MKSVSVFRQSKNMSVLELTIFLLIISSTCSHILPSEGHLNGSNEETIGSLRPRSALQSCKTNVDCVMSNSKCLEGKCRCRVAFIIDGTLTKCLKVATGYNDPCEESIQCSQLLSAGGICSNGTCICKDDYHYLHGQCHLSKGLNEYCERDEECFVNTEYQAVSCKNGFCKCSENFYQRENNTCRRAAKNLGDNCLIDADCLFDKAAQCISQKCSVEKAEITYDESPNDGPTLFYLGGENTSAALMTVVGHNCIKETDCKSLANSHCGLDNKCTCDRAHFWSEELKACVPEIGEKCSSDDEKYKVQSSICKDDVWTCATDRANLKNNQDCRKLSKTIGGSCQYSEQCQLFGPAADCVGGQCVCGEGTHWLKAEKFCWLSRKIEEECWSPNDCHSRASEIQSYCDLGTGRGTCRCPTGSHHSADKGYCIELDSYCEQNDDCELVNSYCNDSKCQCQENYIIIEGLCEAGLNAICATDADCKQNNVMCADNNVCECQENFVASPDKECISTASFEEECEHDVQCTSVTPNTHCALEGGESKEPLKNQTDSQYGQCKCILGYFYNMDSCFRKKSLGEECAMEGECFTESSKSFCRNGMCTCGFDDVQEGNRCRQANSVSGIDTYSIFQLIAVMFLILKMQ